MKYNDVLFFNQSISGHIFSQAPINSSLERMGLSSLFEFEIIALTFLHKMFFSFSLIVEPSISKSYKDFLNAVI